jgi:hypothetical protein
MTTQKILTLRIDADDGERALAQIRQAAGPGGWRIVSLLDLHDTQGFLPWASEYGRQGRRVLVVLEQEPEEEPAIRSTRAALSDLALS